MAYIIFIALALITYTVLRACGHFWKNAPLCQPDFVTPVIFISFAVFLLLVALHRIQKFAPNIQPTHRSVITALLVAVILVMIGSIIYLIIKLK